MLATTSGRSASRHESNDGDWTRAQSIDRAVTLENIRQSTSQPCRDGVGGIIGEYQLCATGRLVVRGCCNTIGFADSHAMAGGY